jgi:predicted Zn finger-like uncharacterized protein
MMTVTNLLIHCPHCQSAFKIAADAVTKTGRDVRCTSCFTCWHLHDDGTNGEILSLHDDTYRGDETVIDDDAPAIHTPSPSLVPDKEHIPLYEAPVKTKKQISKKLVIGSMLAIAIVGFIAGRQSILRKFPQTAPLYAAFGLNTNIIGLDFKNVTSARMVDKGQDILLIEGKIGNLSREVKAIPPIILTVRSRDGKELYSWQTKPAKATLEPFESFDFKTRLASPPLEGHDVSVRFINENDIAKQ